MVEDKNTSKPRREFSVVEINSFLRSLESKNISEVELWIKKGMPLNFRVSPFGDYAEDGTAGSSAVAVRALKTRDEAISRLVLDASGWIDEVGPDGARLLHDAVWSLSLTRDLITRGFDVNHLDDDGRPALYYATLIGNLGVVRELAHNGAVILHVDQQNAINDAMFAAAEIHHVELIDFFESRGADYSLLSREGQSAICHACTYLTDYTEPQRFSDTIQRLISLGADINHLCEETAAHATATLDNYFYLATLIDAGADLSIKDAGGKSVYELASPTCDNYLRAKKSRAAVNALIGLTDESSRAAPRP